MPQACTLPHTGEIRGPLCGYKRFLMPSTILLAHRYPLVREGLKAVFERHTDIDVIGETDSGLEAVTLVARLRPDVIVLSMSVNVTHVRAAMSYGAAGYLLQEVSGNELVQAVREVVAGRPYLSRVLAEHLSTSQGQRASTEVLDPYET